MRRGRGRTSDRNRTSWCLVVARRGRGRSERLGRPPLPPRPGGLPSSRKSAGDGYPAAEPSTHLRGWERARVLVEVQNSAPVGASAGKLLGSAGHNPGLHIGALGRGGLGTLIRAVVGVTAARAHRLDLRVRKRCGKKKGEVRPTRIVRAAGGRHPLTRCEGCGEEATYVGGARTSARDASPQVPRALKRADPKQG